MAKAKVWAHLAREPSNTGSSTTAVGSSASSWLCWQMEQFVARRPINNEEEVTGPEEGLLTRRPLLGDDESPHPV